jgi:hypothetical protein
MCTIFSKIEVCDTADMQDTEAHDNLFPYICYLKKGHFSVKGEKRKQYSKPEVDKRTHYAYQRWRFQIYAVRKVVPENSSSAQWVGTCS